MGRNAQVQRRIRHRVGEVTLVLNITLRSSPCQPRSAIHEPAERHAGSPGESALQEGLPQSTATAIARWA